MVVTILPADLLTIVVNFFKTMSRCISKKKGTNKCTNMVTHILHAYPHLTPLTLRLGPKGQTSTFSEHGHIAFQIKRNHKCSNMVPWGRGHVAYQIKGND